MMEQSSRSLSPIVEDGRIKPLLNIALHDSNVPSSDHSQSFIGDGLSVGNEEATGMRSGIRPRRIMTNHDVPDGHVRTTMPETTSSPQLRNNSPSSRPPQPAGRPEAEGEDEEPATPKSFQRSSSPSLTTSRIKATDYQKVGEEGVSKMHKFSLYETTSRFYLVGGDIIDKEFRILKIDRTTESGNLSIAEDNIVYTKKEMNQLLHAVDDGNKNSGGLKLKCSNWGLLGFIRFTGEYYMLIITKRSQVALIGGHYIYQIDGTELVGLSAPTPSRFKSDRDPEEARFIGILHNLDLSRSFYFSYSYNITCTLQQNIFHEREALRRGPVKISKQYHNDMFVWNHHLLEPVFRTMKNTYDWCLPVVHGFIDQASKFATQYR